MGGERNEWERMETGLESVPTVPNLPLHHCPVGILRDGKVETRIVQKFSKTFIISLTFILINSTTAMTMLDCCFAGLTICRSFKDGPGAL